MADSQIVSHRNGLVLQRRPAAAMDGVAPMYERLATTSDLHRAVVTGDWWLFARLNVVAGELMIGGEVCAAGDVFEMYVPCHSLLTVRFVNARVDSLGFGSLLSLREANVDRPHVRRVPPGLRPELSPMHVLGTIREGVALDPDERAGRLARQVRVRLREVRHSRRPVQDLAQALGHAPGSLTRAFKASYGISIKECIHRSRVSDAVFHMLQGQGILDSAAAAGFEDPSSFYRQFRRITRNTPRQYRPRPA